MHRITAILGSLASIVLTVGQAHGQNILVCDERGHRVLRYDLSSGEIVDHFVAAGIDSLGLPVDLAIDPSGEFLYVTGSTGIFRYDAQTGRPLGKIVNMKFGDGFRGMTFGPDGLLYVTKPGTHEVLKYAPEGGFRGVAVAAQAGGLLEPWRGILFDADGNLLVVSLRNNNVLRFDGQTGDFIDVFVPSSSGLDHPTSMAMDDEGRLYVTSFRGSQVVVRDPDGTIGPLWPHGGGITCCEDIDYIGDGRLLITRSCGSITGSQVYEVLTNGEVVREVILRGGLPSDTHKFVSTVVQPLSSPTCGADFNGDGRLDIFDFLAFQNAFAAGCP